MNELIYNVSHKTQTYTVFVKDSGCPETNESKAISAAQEQSIAEGNGMLHIGYVDVQQDK